MKINDTYTSLLNIIQPILCANVVSQYYIVVTPRKKFLGGIFCSGVILDNIVKCKRDRLMSNGYARAQGK